MCTYKYAGLPSAILTFIPQGVRGKTGLRRPVEVGKQAAWTWPIITQ